MTEKESKLVRAAMDTLENMPVGGIGEEGATQAELDEASGNGDAYRKDANYHTAQQAWLLLSEAIK